MRNVCCRCCKCGAKQTKKYAEEGKREREWKWHSTWTQTQKEKLKKEKKKKKKKEISQHEKMKKEKSRCTELSKDAKIIKNFRHKRIKSFFFLLKKRARVVSRGIHLILIFRGSDETLITSQTHSGLFWQLKKEKKL